MKSVAAIAAVLMLQGAIARAQPTQQCSFQSDYPSPVDANGKPIGALVEVDLYSQVGVVLDDVPPAKRADVAEWLLSQATDYWKARAIRQITLAYYRLNFSNYYVSNQAALPLRILRCGRSLSAPQGGRCMFRARSSPWSMRSSSTIKCKASS